MRYLVNPSKKIFGKYANIITKYDTNVSDILSSAFPSSEITHICALSLFMCIIGSRFVVILNSSGLIHQPIPTVNIPSPLLNDPWVLQSMAAPSVGIVSKDFVQGIEVLRVSIII